MTVKNFRRSSFRGVAFHVEVAGLEGGRRVAPFEFPKKDEGYSEDMGRRQRTFGLTGYVIQRVSSPNYQSARNALKAAFEAAGPGLLVHHQYGTFKALCTKFQFNENRIRFGQSEFDAQFVEAGRSPLAAPGTDTQGAAATAAEGAGQQSAAAFDGQTAAAIPTPPPRPTEPGDVWAGGRTS